MQRLSSRRLGFWDAMCEPRPGLHGGGASPFAQTQKKWLSPSYVAGAVTAMGTVSVKVISSGKTVRIDGLALSRL